MGAIHEFHLQEFVTDVQNGVYGIKSGEIGSSKEVESIFNEAAKADFDNNDTVLSTDGDGFRELVQKGVQFVKQFFNIQDSEIQQKEQEVCADIEAIIPEYLDTYKEVLESHFSSEAMAKDNTITDTLYGMIHSLNNDELKNAYFARLSEATEEIKAPYKKQQPKTENEPAEAEEASAEEQVSEEPETAAEAAPKAIHVMDQPDGTEAKEGDYAVRDNNTYRFTNGEWVQIETAEAETGSKAIHVMELSGGAKAKEGDYAVRDNNTYRFTNGEWVQIKTQ